MSSPGSRKTHKSVASVFLTDFYGRGCNEKVHSGKSVPNSTSVNSESSHFGNGGLGRGVEVEDGLTNVKGHTTQEVE